MRSRLLAASLRHRARQLGLIALAVLAAAASAALIGSFSDRLQDRLTLDLAAFGPNLMVRPQPGGPLLPGAFVEQVRRLPGVLETAGVREPAPERPGTTPQLSSTAELLRLHPSWSLAGRWPAPGEVVMGAAASVPEGARGVGVLTAGDAFDRFAFTALAEGAEVDRIEVRAVPERLEDVRITIESRLAGAEAVPVGRVLAGDARLAGRVRYLLFGIGAVTLALAALTVAAATAALLAERRAELGLLLALGYTVRRVANLLAAELMVVAAIAALVGALLGELGAAGLSRRLLGQGTFGFSPFGSLLAGLAAIAVVGLAIAVALRRISHLDAALVLRGD
ncbi:MAG: FtsX-like permease family protein [Acidobacteriota bacterium]